MVAGRIGDGDTVGTMVRMPSGLRDRIKHSADTYGRSMNSEIVKTLEEKYPPARSFYDEHFASVRDFLSKAARDAPPEVTEALAAAFKLIEMADDQDKDEMTRGLMSEVISAYDASVKEEP